MENDAKFHAPRQLIKWFEKMNINNKITNLKSVFSNGFIVAEVLVRIDPSININQFYDNLSLKKKFHNWEIIQKVLKKKEFELPSDEIRNIIFREDNSALCFAIRLCEFFTKTKINWTAKKAEIKFNYMNPNVTSLMRKDNIVSIIPIHEKKQLMVSTISKHKTLMKENKTKMNLKEFVNKNKWSFLLKEITKLKFQESKSQTVLNKNIKDENTVLLKQYQKNNNNTTKVLSFAEMKNELLISIAVVIEKNYRRFLTPEEQFLTLNQTEIKNVFLNSYYSADRIIEIIIDTCTVYSKTLSELYENNLPDFLSFFEIFIQFLSKLEEKLNFKSKIRLLFKNFGEQLYSESDDFLVIFMENTGFKIIREFCKKHFGKRDFYAAVISSFMPINENEKVEYICQLKENFGDNIRDFSSLLTRIVCFEENFGKDQIYFNTLIYYANFAIQTSSTNNIVNGLKIMHVLASVNCLKIGHEVSLLEFNRLLKIDWWEIRALLIVIISEVLKQINIAKNQQDQENIDDVSILDEDQTDPDVINNEKSINRSADKSSRKKSFDGFQKDDLGFSNQKRSNLQISSTALIEFEKNYETLLKSIFLQIFKPSENINIIKIGLLYIAELTHFYSDISKIYFDILISLKLQTLEILLSESQIKTPLPIVLGTNSFSYEQTGVHHLWNSTVIIHRMSDQIIDTNIKILNEKFSMILKACLKTKIQKKKEEEWLRIFTKLEDILLNSLIVSDICGEILEILKVFLGSEFICKYFSEHGELKFFTVLTKIYCHKGMAIEKQTFLNLIVFLDEEMKATDFIFGVLKKFSENFFHEFLQSNLVEYTNKLASSRRNKAYGNDYLTKLLSV
jgi:hypothetical protein